MHLNVLLSIIWSCTFTCLEGASSTTQEHDKFGGYPPDRESDHISSLAIIHEDSDSPISQSLATQKYDWAAICVGLNGYNYDRSYCMHTFQKADCDGIEGSTRAITVFCRATCIKTIKSRISKSTSDVTASYTCPQRTSCEPIHFLSATEGDSLEEVGCIDEEHIKRATYVAGSGQENWGKDMYCAPTLQLPGDNYHAVPNQQSIEIILTEHVHKTDGTPLDVPMLYIRDTTDPKKQYDRVLRRDASVASTLLEIGSYRGRMQQRTFQFCMQMTAKYVASSAVFVYSYIQVPLRHSRVLAQVDREQPHPNPEVEEH